MPNPLLTESELPFELPNFAQLSDPDYREAIATGITAQRAELDEIATNTAPASVENVLEAWERSGALLTRAVNAFYTCRYADGTDGREEIAVEFAPKLAAHEDSIQLDRRLYDRLRALAARVEAGEVEADEQASYLLAERLRGYERNGIHLSSADQDQLREFNTQLATLDTDFENLAVAGRNAAAVQVLDEAELDGLSDEQIAELKAAAERAGVDGWLIEQSNTSDHPLIGLLRNRDLRQRVYTASITRGLGPVADTRANLLAQVRLREERARLLGFANHADYVAQDGVAGSSARVMEMLTRIAAGASLKAEREAAVLVERFAEIAPGETFQPWDWAFVADVVRQERYQTDDAAVRPYLEFEAVLHDGVFAAATAVYGLTFAPRPDLISYTPEARVYEVVDADGSTLGALSVDPYVRPTKQGGAWMTSITEQSHLLGKAPSVTNTCNLPKPSDAAPSLLSWDNVTTLFHEFGHALHGLLSDVRYPSRSGTSVPSDFVEYPSQVNEIWAWQPWLLQRYARHYATGAPMPQEMIDTLVAARDYGSGFADYELLAAMLLDQAWHSTPAAELPSSIEGVEAFEQAALEAAGMTSTLIPPRYRSTYFSHIFGGGYSAAYYSYMWSEIMDADTVAWFEEQTGEAPGGRLVNSEELRQAGERFRRELLGRGGSIDPMESYRRFRGADPDVSHLLKRMGID